MNTAEFTALIALVSLTAGFIGSLTGLGGGVVIVPVLTVLFGVDIHYAIGASLVSVIATSSGAAAAYVREGWSNIRVGMFLEIATCMGALSGAFLATILPVRTIAIIFGIVLLWSAWISTHFKRRLPKRSHRGTGSRRSCAWTEHIQPQTGIATTAFIMCPAGFWSCWLPEHCRDCSASDRARSK